MITFVIQIKNFTTVNLLSVYVIATHKLEQVRFVLVEMLRAHGFYHA